MTIKLYEQDIYLKECLSNVIDVVTNDKGTFVTLDQTIFYPEGGGQPSDTGMIGNSKVLDVIEKNGEHLHKVDVKPETVEVKCVLNWERRLDNMQQHCGEHILSGVILEKYNGVNKGFRMGEDYITIDINLPKMTDEMLTLIEVEANKAIVANQPILIHNVNTLEEAQKYPVRKAITVDENIRIVEINGVDCVACCGSHPTRTGDVGLIKLLKSENYKGMTRIYFKCGMRAIKDYQLKHTIITELSKKYSAEESALLNRITAEEEKGLKLREEYNKLKKKINEEESQKLINAEENGLVYGLLEESDTDDLSAITKRITDTGSYLVLLGTNNGNKVILTHSGARDTHCGKLFKESIKDFNGRGGGGDKMAQGVFQTNEDVIKFMEHIKKTLNL